MYFSNVRIIRVIDGDSIKGMVDLGFGIFKMETFRLYGINAPEVRGKTKEAGEASRDHLIMLTGKHQPIQFETIKNTKGEDRQGKFGRYLVRLIGRNGIDLNLRMMQDGHAEPSPLKESES